jgi:hypothetical protein
MQITSQGMIRLYYMIGQDYRASRLTAENRRADPIALRLDDGIPAGTIRVRAFGSAAPTAGPILDVTSRHAVEIDSASRLVTIGTRHSRWS